MNSGNPLQVFDGEDEIIYSQTSNVYQDKLVLNSFLGFNFSFIFEQNNPQVGQSDVVVETKKDKKEVRMVFSKKFRNPLGSSTTEKLPIFTRDEDGRKILISVAGQQSGACLHVTINFYLR